MANLLWGKVYYQDTFVGYLRQEVGKRISFTYDASYIEQCLPAIAYHLPLRPEPFLSHTLPPFFDNLVAEGWLEKAQSRLLNQRHASRFELLLAFGYDCAGAVSVIDPEPASFSEAMLDHTDPKEMAILTHRASLSGVQAKLSLVKRNNQFFPSTFNELSTHIAKFASDEQNNVIFNEYLSLCAFKALLPNDSVVQAHIGCVVGFSSPVLIIKRFDRAEGKRIHFEEFNSLLNQSSVMKYEGAHKDMADFIEHAGPCLAIERYRLFLRILAGILLGNTDMHLKNFAMFHTPTGLRLTPSYDQVAAVLYDYKTLALRLAGTANLPIEKLKARSIIRLGKEFFLSDDSILMAVHTLEKNLDRAVQAVYAADIGCEELKNTLTQLMRKKWNGIFAFIGQTLSKKQ